MINATIMIVNKNFTQTIKPFKNDCAYLILIDFVLIIQLRSCLLDVTMRQNFLNYAVVLHASTKGKL